MRNVAFKAAMQAVIAAVNLACAFEVQAGSTIIVDVQATSPTMQTVGIDQPAPYPFTVLATANGSPVAGLSVDFSNGCFNFACFHIYGHFVDGSLEATALTDLSGVATAPEFIASDHSDTESGVSAGILPQVVDGISYEQDQGQAPTIFYVEAHGGLPVSPVSTPTLDGYALCLLATVLVAVAYTYHRRRGLYRVLFTRHKRSS